MLMLPPSVQVFVASEPVDMRKGIDGLAGIVRTQWKQDVFSGHLFVFYGRRGHLLKLLFFDRGGFVLYIKRLERGKFFWPQAPAGERTVMLQGSQLAMLLDGVKVAAVSRPNHWEPPRAASSAEKRCQKLA